MKSRAKSAGPIWVNQAPYARCLPEDASPGGPEELVKALPQGFRCLGDDPQWRSEPGRVIITPDMEASHNRKHMTTRVIRPDAPPLDDAGWDTATPEERINAVWELTLLCLAWQGDQTDEPRLQRSVSRVQRSGVEYLVVGAHALAAHGHVRATG